ncbi:Hypothetical protein ACA1_295680 [Acanthamoeba castellanii str. Neff]|uniref:ER membrane protein complex subunit 10 n=1 Tax=Acanthamoeba castellanii (strain ATCC 30010 / Neff) TaxID=1257118 RepID=L8HJU6_ACACF|nr:Hypothetical protein ACA1_295680 [Acanthamoeba castellanii str. Neff]ELR25482.1 Hypothetical protein ACA1_295680 [Acanthamoeba castellanii str. Neff]
MRATQRLNVLVAIAALICGIVGVYGQQQDATVQLSIEHAIGGAPFTPRGQEAAASGGRYQVRLQLPLTKDTRRQMDFITASVPACALLASNLADSLRLTLDQFGNVVGVDYRTATADCGSATEQPTSSKFDTKVSLNVGAEAPKPFRQELETPEAAKEKAEGEKGFIAKYWMYIVPFVLVLLFSGGMGGQEPEAAQGGEGAAPAASGSFTALFRGIVIKWSSIHC